jgi:3D-(3,5/4)-trihydroxycyclohexane-1,2-dione acylhydrolase (decyclizing)
VHYSAATRALAEFATRHRIPVVETIAGMASLLHSHPLNIGTVGVTGTDCANAICGEGGPHYRSRYAAAGFHYWLLEPV